MARNRRISSAERKRMDYLRRQGLKVGHVYESRLRKLRRKEVKRLLSMCRDFDPAEWAQVIDYNLREDYLQEWFRGLYVDAGLPRARSVARDLSRGKAAPGDDAWERELAAYADERAAQEVVLLQGTMKDELIKVVRGVMAEDTQMGIEKLSRRILAGYRDIELWQARRIAQTETMIGLADAGAIAARTLDVGFTKVWAISGLGNTRETHELMDGMEVDMDEPFTLPEGAQMMYPHDGSLGAPAGEIINCACDVLRHPK